MMSLSIKHKSFCDEYLSNGLNATRAYKSVYGADDKVCESSGARLLRNGKVSQYINEQQEKTSERLQISKEELIQDLVRIKNSNLETRPTTSMKAIEIINKMLGLNAAEKTDITISEQPLFPDEE
jgi:phage terminase small subunit